MKKYDGFAIDIESNGFIFESTKIWSIVCTDLNDKNRKLKLNPFKDENAYAKLYEFLTEYDNPYIVFHNGLGFDVFVLMNILGCEHTVGPDTFMGVPVQFVDTFYLSMFLNPDRQGHSVEYFGEKLGLPKIDFRQELIDIGFLSKDAPRGQEFMQYHPLMDTYCDRDTDVNVMIFHGLCKEWKEIYKSDFAHTQAYKCGQKSFYLMSCQELAGWKFDIQKAQALAVRIEQMMEEIRAEVEPKLPPRSLKKGEEKDYTMPAKPFKKDGSYSSTWEKFVEKHKGKQVGDKWEFYGELYDVKAGQLLDVKLPMEMANQDQMKEYFLESGWKPTLFNYKRGPDGKPMRDQKTRELIKTTPKIQEAGKICPNLLEMEGDIVKQVVKWLSLRNRQSVLQGWLENPRLQMDGRIGAGRTGIAATHRQKHKTVVNVPKASEKVLLGNEFRELWTCEDGFLIAAADAAALEGRVQGHYTTKYDGGATADELLKGDVHCFSEDTEILTPNGWKRFNDLEGESVAQYREGVIEFVKPSEVIWEKYEGTMIHFESASLDKLVTPNHRVLLQSHKTGKEVVKFAKDVPNTNADLRIRVAGDSEGVQLSSAEITLISAIQSDAYDSGCAYRFEFKKARKTERLIGALAAMNVGYAYSEGETSRIYISKKGLGSIQPYITEDRELSYELLKVCGDAGKELLKEYGHWDGTVKENGDIVLDTTSRQTVEVLQALACRSGMKTSLTVGIKKVTTFGECYLDRLYISVASKPVVRVYGVRKEVEYSGMIGCVTVPSGFIVVRRNGKVCVSGNSKNAFAFYGSIYKDVAKIYMSPNFNKDDPKWKPYRDRSKNGFYAILYGASGPKVASTLGIEEHHGQNALEAFWDANPGTKSLKDNLEKYWEQVGQKKYLPSIDSRMLCTRKKSALLNTIFQSCGGIAMDYALCFMDHWLGKIYWEDRKPYYIYKGYKVRRIGYMHDETEFEAEAPIAEEIGEMIVKAIKKAGEFLKIKVPLEGEAKVGLNWRSVH